MKNLNHPSNPILLVDDETAILNSFRSTLRSEGIDNLITLQDSREIKPFFARQPVELVLLDLSMPHLSGEEILAWLTQEHPDVPVIVITGVNDVETAVTCIQSGAIDYIVKPVDPSQFVSKVKQVIENRELKRENISLKDRLLTSRLEHPQVFNKIITQNATMHSIFQYLEMVAKTSRPVMITGESGVGKELIADCVHVLSNRPGAFVSVNIAGLDDTLFTDTLFGHVQGAYSGALESRPGLVSRAAKGTLFLDEIGDLELSSQVKLLRVIQEGEYYPLGSDLAKKTDARIVVATQYEPEKLLQEGRFRKDLYYRLNIHQVHIPPLRMRMEDLPLLVEHFIQETADSLGLDKPQTPLELFTLLSAYHFPGNVRELQNLIFDAVTQHRQGTLSTQGIHQVIENLRKEGTSLAEGMTDLAPGAAFALTLDARMPFPTLKHTDRFLVREAMKRAQGNQKIAAEMLGVTRQTLNNRFKENPSLRGPSHSADNRTKSFQKRDA